MPHHEPIMIRNLANGCEFKETIEGEGWLRFLYEHPLGPPLLHSLVIKPWFSQLYGRKMNSPASRSLIEPFILKHGLDPKEFLRPVSHYQSFNDFFTRQLQPDARTIDPDPQAIVFPADGRHLLFPDASAADRVFVKGQKLDVAALLDDQKLASRYASAPLLISRLCPVDYHRFHFPYGGKAGPARLINGALFSVSPIALRKSIARLWQNKRTVTLLESETAGTLLLLEIGATMVGSIEQTYPLDTPILKGAEKGIFHVGGSTTMILLDPAKSYEFNKSLLRNSREGYESYAKMGTAFARVEVQ